MQATTPRPENAGLLLKIDPAQVTDREREALRLWVRLGLHIDDAGVLRLRQPTQARSHAVRLTHEQRVQNERRATALWASGAIHEGDYVLMSRFDDYYVTQAVKVTPKTRTIWSPDRVNVNGRAQARGYPVAILTEAQAAAWTLANRTYTEGYDALKREVEAKEKPLKAARHAAQAVVLTEVGVAVPE